MLDLSAYTVLLASNSPRRQELLKVIVPNYEIMTFDNLDESYPDNLAKSKVATFIALKKAESYRHVLKSDSLLITADTVVLLEDKVYGKPKDEEQACLMLAELSGKRHQVMTGVCITTVDKQVTFCDVSTVSFSKLTGEDIAFYVSTYKPLDKAGAYGIQEWIGYVGVNYIEGSYFNIMGLPVHRLYDELTHFSVK